MGFFSESSDVKILLVPCYLPPENSPWGEDSDHFFNHLTSLLYTEDDTDLVVIAGDFNARTGNKVDYIQDIDRVPIRNTIDQVVNRQGDAFLNFLLSNKLCILNGRIEGEDNFTYLSSQGRSVVDYFVTHNDCLQYFKHMYVKSCTDIMDDCFILPTCSIPDHTVLILDTNVSEFLQERESRSRDSNQEISVTNKQRYLKEFNVSNLNYDFMTDDSINSEILNFNHNISTLMPSQSSINELYETFIQIHRSEMKRKLPAIEYKNKPKYAKQFWNDNLSRMYKETVNAEREFRNCRGADKHMKRDVYKTKQSNFDKHFKKVKNDFCRNTEIEIETMVGRDGKNMWKLLEKIGPKVNQKLIPLEVIIDDKIITNEKHVLNKWNEDFASLYKGVPCNAAAYDNEFLNQVVEGQITMNINYCDTDDLNREITLKEVKTAVQQAKANKAVSIDKLPNEIFKNESSINMIHALFNY